MKQIRKGRVNDPAFSYLEAVSGFEPEENGVANRHLKHSATPPLNQGLAQS
jgi:hypothetical protein